MKSLTHRCLQTTCGTSAGQGQQRSCSRGLSSSPFDLYEGSICSERRGAHNRGESSKDGPWHVTSGLEQGKLRDGGQGNDAEGRRRQGKSLGEGDQSANTHSQCLLKHYKSVDLVHSFTARRLTTISKTLDGNLQRIRSSHIRWKGSHLKTIHSTEQDTRPSRLHAFKPYRCKTSLL